MAEPLFMTVILVVTKRHRIGQVETCEHPGQVGGIRRVADQHHVRAQQIGHFHHPRQILGLILTPRIQMTPGHEHGVFPQRSPGDIHAPG